MISNTIPKDLIGYIQEQIEKTPYGEITVELSESKKGIDVVTTSRKRFNKEDPPHATIPGPVIFKQG